MADVVATSRAARAARAAAQRETPKLLVILSEFDAEMDASADDVFESQHAYMRHVELQFTLRMLAHEAREALMQAFIGGPQALPPPPPAAVGDAAKAGKQGSSEDGTLSSRSASPGSAPPTAGATSAGASAVLGASSDELEATYRICARMLAAMTALGESRVQATADAGLPRPRVLRLAEAYKLSPVETAVLQFMAVRYNVQGSPLRNWIYHPGGWSTLRPAKYPFYVLCGATELDLEEFQDDKRVHIKENALSSKDNYDEGKTMALTPEVALVIWGRKLKSDQSLKVSETHAARVVKEDEDVAAGARERAASEVEDKSGAGEGSAGGTPKDDTGGEGVSDDGAPADAIPVLIRTLSHPEGKLSSARATGASGGGGNGRRSGSGAVSPDGIDVSGEAGVPGEAKGDDGADDAGNAVDAGDGSVGDDGADEGRGAAAGAGAGGSSDAEGGDDDDEGEEDEEDKIRPYKSSLDYLDDQFQLVVQALRIGQERRAESMKKAGTKDTGGRYYSYGEAPRVNKHEAAAKHKLIKSRIQARLKLTKTPPRLEAMATKLNLTPFEKDVVVMLIARTISPVVKSVLREDHDAQGMKVHHILEAYCETFKDQIEHRNYFYRSATLVRRGIIKLTAAESWRGDSNDLVDQGITIDRRILDHIVGLDTEIAEIQEGSNLYTPTVGLDNVVLRDDIKKDLMLSVDHFATFQKYRRKAGLDDKTYGAGLTILLSGPSGTGKTLTVNAIAKHLGKRVLLVNFPLLDSATARSHGEAPYPDLRGLFREAEMQNALLFFDECESLLAQRGTGGSSTMTMLLTEMEAFSGVIFLATNRPLDLDEAMFRRITAVFDFAAPDYMQRLLIWRLHTSHEGYPIDDDVDFDKIALQFELAGGFIRNSCVSALLMAISRDAENPRVCEEDILKGCALQMRGSLRMRSFAHRVVPKLSMDDLILPVEVKAKLSALVDHEKARGVLFGQWGFAEAARERAGTTVLFWGPPGTGKSSAAEAVGFAVGKPLKVVNFSSLMEQASKGELKSGKDAIVTTFEDARLMNAVLVLDEFGVELFMISEGGGGGGGGSESSFRMLGSLMYEMARFPGLVILSVTARKSLDMSIHRFHPDFLRRIGFLVSFKEPSRSQRAKLWAKMLPDKTPRDADIDFKELASIEIAGGSIASAIYRAAASAALRPEATRRVTQADLTAAAKEEKDKVFSEVREMAARQYV